MKSENNPGSQTKPLKFQAAMSRLQEIVNQLSDGSLDLEEAMDLFKEGLTLSRQCEKQLNAFDVQMNELLKENNLENGADANG